MEPLNQPNILNSLPQIHPDHHKSKIIWLIIAGVLVIALIVVAIILQKRSVSYRSNGPLTEAQRAEILKNLQDGTTGSNAKPLTEAERAALLKSLSGSQTTTGKKGSTTKTTQSKPLTQEQRDQILRDLSN